MAFPTIQFKATNTELDQTLTNLVEQKFASLDKFFEDDAHMHCEVEFEKETAHQSGNHFRVEANLTVGGTLHRAEASEENFEKAIDTVRNELDKEIRRTTSKKETLFKKGSRAVKDMMRFGS